MRVPLSLAVATGLSIPLCFGGCTAPGSVGGGGDDSAGGADAGEDIVGNPACQQREPIELGTGAPPDLLLVVDKSGSMDDPLASGQQKWTVMRDALMTVVGQYQSNINFGLMLFPQGQECAAGNMYADIAPENGQAIYTSLNQTFPNGGTPTHTTLEGARSYFQSRTGADQRYVLLATDGEPNCGDPVDFEEPTVQESLTAISALSSDGISTFVLGFGGTINTYPEVLEQMAQAGNTGDYFAANSPDELATALDAIASEVGVPSCTFRLDQTVDDPSRMTVFADNVEIPSDPGRQMGWAYDDTNNTITLYGNACDSVRDGSTGEVRIEFGCDSGNGDVD